MTHPTLPIARLACAALLALSSVHAAQDSAPRVELEALDGTVQVLALDALDLADPRGSGAWFVRPLDVPSMVRDASARRGAEAAVELADGGVLRGRILDGAGETITLELVPGVEVPLNIERVRSIRPIGFEAEPVVVFEPAREGDRLVRRVGDKVDPTDGTLEAFTPDGVRFESSTIGSKEYRWSEVAALFIEALDDGRGDADAAADERCPVSIDLSDGSRLSATLIRLKEEGCVIEKAGAELVLPWSIVHEIAVADGAFRYLTEQPAVREEGRGAPFGDDIGMVWNHRVDRSVAGGALRSGGKTFRRGIGMHAPTRVVWALDGEYRVLRARVAIDDSSLLNPAHARGSVVFRVRLDERVAWESPVLRGGDSALRLPEIELGDARELTLEVDMAGDFSGDRANWLRVLLVR